MPVLADYYARSGVTSFLATTMTLKGAGAHARHARRARRGDTGAARCAGVHLEGPFLSYNKRGAQNPDNLHAPDADMLERLDAASGGAVRMVTVAPEVEGAEAFIPRASRLCTVSVGHTEADYGHRRPRLRPGRQPRHAPLQRHAAHPPPQAGRHRRGLRRRASTEIICDGLHVHPSAVRMAFAIFAGRLSLISDSLRCAGMPDGEYELGGLPIRLSGGVARLLDGTIAGSCINVGEAVRRAVSFGVPLETAIEAATVVPARAAKLDDCGSLAAGKRADIAVLDQDLNIKAVFIAGRQHVM